MEKIKHIDSGINGYNIEMETQDRARIDKLVKEYEKKIITNVEKEYLKSTTLGDKIADSIAGFGGSWRFIIILGMSLFIWIMWNTLWFIPYKFDEKPFVLLNLALSFTASFQAPIIMMSQNRQASREKNESIINFAINYKSEKEIQDIQGHLHRVEEDIQEIKKMLSGGQSGN